MTKREELLVRWLTVPTDKPHFESELWGLVADWCHGAASVILIGGDVEGCEMFSECEDIARQLRDDTWRPE